VTDGARVSGASGGAAEATGVPTFAEMIGVVEARAADEARLREEYGWLMEPMGDDAETWVVLGQHVDQARFAAQFRELQHRVWAITDDDLEHWAPTASEVEHSYCVVDASLTEQTGEVCYRFGVAAGTPGAEPCTVFYS
jgi:hypothetical protein